jgi:hypothetical protein
MTKLVTIAAVLAVLLTVSASAQTTRVYVPFQFIAAGDTLPAGEYQVEVDKACRRIELRSLDGRSGLFATANPVYRPSGASDKGMLTFQKYGNTYVLRSVWYAGAVQGRELPAGKVERELARVNGPAQIASIAWPR